MLRRAVQTHFIRRRGCHELTALSSQLPLGIALPERELPSSRSHRFSKAAHLQRWVDSDDKKTQPSSSNWGQLSVSQLPMRRAEAFAELNCSPVSPSAQPCLFLLLLQALTLRGNLPPTSSRVSFLRSRTCTTFMLFHGREAFWPRWLRGYMTCSGQ